MKSREREEVLNIIAAKCLVTKRQVKKKINNKFIEINNINLFISAMEGIKKPTLMASETTTMVPEDTALVNKIISAYDTIYKKFPYPLYSMEIDLKYVVLGELIKDSLRDADFIYSMWVSNGNGLYIELSDIVLHFKGRSYTFEPSATEKKDEIRLLDYKNCNAYKEFMWVYDRILTGKSTTEFYREFFKDLVDACEDSKALKRELGNILVFTQVPAQGLFKDNALLDVTRHKHYILDIYTDKKIPLKKREFIVDTSKGIIRRDVEERVYDFIVYAKDCKDNTVNSSDFGKMYKLDYEGLAGVFEKIVGEGTLSENISTLNYRGVVIDDTVIFEISNKVYLRTLQKYTKPKCILRNASLYAVTENGIYITERERLDSGVMQECTYYYDVQKNQLIICKVGYMSLQGK